MRGWIVSHCLEHILNQHACAQACRASSNAKMGGSGAHTYGHQRCLHGVFCGLVLWWECSCILRCVAWSTCLLGCYGSVQAVRQRFTGAVKVRCMETWFACRRVVELEIAKHWMDGAAGCLRVAAWIAPAACVGLLGIAADAMHLFGRKTGCLRVLRGSAQLAEYPPQRTFRLPAQARCCRCLFIHTITSTTSTTSTKIKATA
jgi:hypothetical protein